MRGINRRQAVAASAALLGACSRPAADALPPWTGAFVGDAVAAGHRWRDGGAQPPRVDDRKPQRCGVLIVGAGIAGLAAARALREAGIDDVTLLELHAQAGGNSRGHRIDAMPCPLGAHYLPVPDDRNPQLLRWLHEIGLARQESGRTVFDERHLCHSPQERVWHDGAWHEGLLPALRPGSPAHAQAGKLSTAIDALARELGFAMPAAGVDVRPGHAALDAQSFARWLDAQGITDPLLRWYLDYCCLDDYGAPAAAVSAWAGVHYFASRHGFRAPGVETEAGSDAVLTWPEGNAWLVRRLAEPLGERVKTGWLVSRVQEQRDHVEVWAQDVSRESPAGGPMRRWLAQQVILATPLKWAVRAWPAAPAALARGAGRLTHAPWLVANLMLDRPLADRPGVAPAWDNVVAGRTGLGYVDSAHQSLGFRPAAHVLTAYHALPIDQRPALLAQPWSTWSRWVVDDLTATHADLPARVRRVDIARHGHAMAIPAPGVRSDADLVALRAEGLAGRVQVAHADLAGYSVFEEAFDLGLRAGARVAAAMGARRPPV